MAGISVNRITNANVYVDGASLMGKAEEIKLPDVTSKMTEHKGLGMIGTIELFAGLEKLEGEVKWSSFYKDVAAKAVNPFKAVSLQVRCSVETYGAQGRVEQKPLVTFLTVTFKKAAIGAFKQHENAEFPNNFACHYIKQVLAGEEILEVDFFANIFKINGVDQLAELRANIE